MEPRKTIIVSILQMLRKRYDSDHHVTVSRALQLHIQDSFAMGKRRSVRETRGLCRYLCEKEILKPFTVGGKSYEETWRIDLKRLNGHLREIRSENN